MMINSMLKNTSAVKPLIGVIADGIAFGMGTLCTAGDPSSCRTGGQKSQPQVQPLDQVLLASGY